MSGLIAEATCPGTIDVPLAGVTVPVLHPGMWPPAAVVALSQADWAGWAVLCTADDGTAWAEADPTPAEITGFFDQVEDATGQPLQTIADVTTILDTHPGEVTADLARWYHTDIADLWRPGSGLTWRKVKAFLDHLPPESATKTAFRDALTSKDFQSAPEPEGWGPWSRTDELLALLIDRAAWQTYATLAVAGGKPSDPEPVRRPGVGLTGRERREIAYWSAVTAAHVQYLRDNAGANPPPGWDPGVDPDDYLTERDQALTLRGGALLNGSPRLKPGDFRLGPH